MGREVDLIQGQDVPVCEVLARGGLVREDTAISLIENVVYRPGWVFECEPHGNVQGGIRLKITYPANNFNRDQAADGYPSAFNPFAAFPILAGKCHDAEALYRQVIEQCFKVDQHEGREAFRVKPNYWAPFHPHHPDGMDRWGDPQADLFFGAGA